ncbi:MAG: hypothetical protein M3O28_11070 [Actinomycetota bacterium]|nr:hypothetical protein [Actinomycetota bacterium]
MTDDVTQLSKAPALGPLYARAAVTGPLHRGSSLPDSVYELADQRIDRDHLAAYQGVCGFRLSDELPPTYLHVLAFPLSVALMVRPAFPFPLVGLVHVANSITVVRPVDVAEQVSLRVWAADLRPHKAGQQLDLLAEARVGGERVWAGRSTYLRRGAHGAHGTDEGAVRSRQTETPAPSEQAAASEQAARSAPAAQVRVVEHIGRRYGAVSGDRNPIHMHALTARAFGFPRAIAHGMWLKARTLACLEGRLPASFAVDVSFKTPVLLPSTVAITSVQQEGGWELDVRNAKSGKPHLAGRVRAC